MKKSILASLLLFGLLTTFVSVGYAAEDKRTFEIEYETTDKFVTISTLTFPKAKKDRYPLVVLLHSIGYGSSYWETLPLKFRSAGFAVLEVDFKGHGKSTNDIYYKKRSWIYLDDSAFQLLPSEVLEVVKKTVAEHENIIPTFISYVGADLGANVAIHTAEMQFPKPVCLALISPYITFKGLYTPVALADIGEVPLMVMTTEKDAGSVKQMETIAKYALGKREKKLYPNGGTGMIMLKVNPTMENDIVNWVVEKYNDALK